MLQHICFHADLFITYHVVKVQTFSEQVLTVKLCNLE